MQALLHVFQPQVRHLTGARQGKASPDDGLPLQDAPVAGFYFLEKRVCAGG